MNHCHICDATPTGAFRLSWALDESSPEGTDITVDGLPIGKRVHRAIAQTVQPVKALKSGELFQCPLCNRYWCLYADFLHPLSNAQASLLRQWDSVPLPVSEDIRESLADIGGVASSRSGMAADADQIVIPVRLVSTNGLEVETARIFISMAPPILDSRGPFMLGSEVREVHASDFALPLTVRTACANARETSFGFRPTWVCGPDGSCLILDGTQMFFAHDNLRGKDMRLANVRSRSRRAPVVGFDDAQVTTAYFDWYEGCMELAPPGAPA